MKILHAVEYKFINSTVLIIAGYALAMFFCAQQAFAGQSDASMLLEPTRQFSPVPPVGVHPRVLMSPGDLPGLKQRLLHSASGKVMMQTAEEDEIKYKPLFEKLGALRLETITPVTLREYFKPDEARNPAFLMTALLGIVQDRPNMRRLAIGAIVGYSDLILRSRALDYDAAQPRNALTTSTSNDTSLWHSHHWDVSTGWLFGGPGLALTYDFLYNDMTPAERDTVRKAISAATSGRRSWGLAEPNTRAVSNWTLYHGHMLVMALAIEGEPGYDAQLYPLWVKLAHAYLRHAFTDGGSNFEDSYPLGTSFRDSASMFVAMARRGDNFYLNPRYQGYMRYVLESLEPFPNGGFIGHAAGGSLGYPSFWVTNHYVFPKSPVANYEWHFYAGDNYRKHLQFQSYVDLMLFSSDWSDSLPGWNNPAALDLPEAVYYPGRGLAIMRSDWGPKELLVHFDARPDAFLIGHDNADRGTFTVTALGKTWAPDLDWMGFQYGDEHSLVQIDGASEPYKAPSANFLSFQDDRAVVLCKADLSYAYDWQWPLPWPSAGEQFPKPWTIEPNDPRTLGLPDTIQWNWVPHRLTDEPEVGFAGLNFWRRPYNPVQFVLRTLAFVRGEHPWLLVVDDVKKDGKPHNYEWMMQLANDVTIEKQQGNDIYLSSTSEPNAQLLVRMIPPTDGWGPERPSVRIDHYLGRNTPGKGANIGKHMQGTRLIISRDGVVEPQFKIAVMPLQDGDPLPVTKWEPKEILHTTWGSQQTLLRLQATADGKTVLTYLAREPATHQ